jgi:2-haloacid dehalogenase
MAVDGLKVDVGRICFILSNTWDALAAENFGFRVIWVNLFNQTQERIPGK